MSLQALAMWDPQGNAEEPVFALSREALSLQLRFAVLVAAVFGIVVVAHLLDTLIRLCAPYIGRRRIHWFMLVTLPLAWAPIYMRCNLPMESPYDGAGSPLALFIGVMIHAVIGAVIALPGFALLAFRRAESGIASIA